MREIETIHQCFGMSIIAAPPIFVIFVVSLALFFAAVEIGFRMGLSRSHNKDILESAPAGIVTGSILGLTSFLLAFTFGFAASNYTDRRGVVLDEANAIGTAYLRADLMPAETAVVFRAELLEYTQERVDIIGSDHAARALVSYLNLVDTVHADMWALVSEMARTDPSPSHALVVSALNDVIDLHAERVAFGTRHMVPFPIWISLFAVSCIALGTTGYRFGVSFEARSELMPAMVVAFACVITVIADLNTPNTGFMQTDQRPMEDLLVMMKR